MIVMVMAQVQSVSALYRPVKNTVAAAQVRYASRTALNLPSVRAQRRAAPMPRVGAAVSDNVWRVPKDTSASTAARSCAGSAAAAISRSRGCSTTEAASVTTGIARKTTLVQCTQTGRSRKKTRELRR